MPTPAGSSCLVRAPRSSFPRGITWLAREGKTKRGQADMRMDFGIQRLRAGEKFAVTTEKETLWVLLEGAVTIVSAAGELAAQRASLFDENPTAIHAGVGETVELRAGGKGAELAIVRTTNGRKLGVRYYRPTDVSTEDRGAGLAQGACRRAVRAIFDYPSRPESNLVVGEVINLPGRWSSYPPHHHPQPEIYHYRFTLPQGYGHAEVGDDVLKVRSGDTTRIPGGLDHAQVSAPGYGMYYLWIVRHLPGRPYKGFKFTADHSWLLDAKQQGWTPANSLFQ